MGTVSDIVGMIKRDLLTEKQREYIECYIRNGRKKSATDNELVVAANTGSTILHSKVVKLALDVADMQEVFTDNDESVTIEWIQTEWVRLYRAALARGDEEEASKRMTKIMEFKKVFGDLEKISRDNIKRLSQDSLAKYIKEKSEEIIMYIKKPKWREVTNV